MILKLQINLRPEFINFLGSEKQAEAYIVNEMKELLDNNLNKPMTIKSWTMEKE
jgi:hypothetical protein